MTSPTLQTKRPPRLATLAVSFLLLLQGHANAFDDQDKAFRIDIEHGPVAKNIVADHSWLRASNDTMVSSSSSCASIEDCESCSKTYTCHWCASDKACHAKGSIHGCSWGASCHSEKKNKTGCASHSTCSDCVLSSHLCHWCAHDDACHAVGSTSGCVTGVNCYSNDRCRRKESEAYPKYIFTELPPYAVLFVLLFGLVMLCTASCCFSRVVKNLVGAYNDVADPLLSGSRQTDTVVGASGRAEMDTNDDRHTDGIVAVESGEQVVDNDESVDASGADALARAAAGPNAAGLETQKEDLDEQSSEYVELEGLIRREGGDQNDDEYNNNNNEVNATTPLLGSGHEIDGPDDGADVHDAGAPNQQRTVRSFSSPHMRSFFRFCQVLHNINLVFIILVTLAVIHFFPKMPSYNVCNDSVAWKAIMDSIASLKLDASFEILISVDNPNHVDVLLKSGSGVFKYKGKTAGTFSLPSNLNIQGMAVTDLMVNAQIGLADDKYQAMQLAADYYRGKLVLVIDFDAHLRALGLARTLQIRDRNVYVNELSDRSLCACPSWDDPTPNDRMLSGEMPMPWESVLQELN